MLSLSALLVSSLGEAGALVPETVAVIDTLAQDCTQIPPENVPPLSLSSSETLGLDVRVMFESGDKQTVKSRMETTQLAFARIGINLDVSYERVKIPKSWKEGGALSSNAGSDEHFELMKDRHGGERPQGVDVVYFFSRYWGGGMADCIGGVRYPERAFAFGSMDYAVEGIVPVPTVDEGVIAAHEIGHLLGAHHHYSNCVEAAPRGAEAGEPAVCTTMSPAAATASTFFSVMETSFVRYYTKEYAQN